jgi:hypothetical protein
MPDNPNTDSESSYLDAEDWQIALEPYEGKPQAALTLGFHLVELKRYVNSLKMNAASGAIDRAIDCLYEHSDFRRVSRELFLIAIEGRLTTDRETLLRELGIRGI